MLSFVLRWKSQVAGAIVMWPAYTGGISLSAVGGTSEMAVIPPSESLYLLASVNKSLVRDILPTGLFPFQCLVGTHLPPRDSTEGHRSEH